MSKESEKKVEMKYEGVENTIHVPQHRVERYKARGWKPVPAKKGD